MQNRLLVSLLFFCFATFSSHSADAQFRKLNRMVKRGKFEKSLAFAARKMSTLDKRKAGRHKLQAYHLTLGKIHYMLGDYIQAERAYRTSLDMVNQRLNAGKRLKLRDFDVMDELALFYVNTGNFQQGRQYIDQSLKLRIRKFNKNNPTNFRPYLPLGLLYFYQNHFDSARHYLTIYQKEIRNSNYTGFLDINRYADTYQVLSEISLKTGDLRRARKFARKSVRLQRHPWTKKESGKNYIARVKALNALSVVYRLTDKVKKAEALNRKALSLYLKKYGKQNYVLAPVYINRAWLAAYRNKVDSTRQYLRSAMNLQQDFIENNFSHLSEYEKENYHARLRESFHDINNIVLALYGERKISKEDELWSDMLNYIINTKAVILSNISQLTRNMTQSNDDELKAMFARWKNLKHQKAFPANSSRRKNQQAIAGIQNEINALEKEMTVRSGAIEKNAGQRVDWKDIKANLEAQEAAVEFARVEQGDRMVTYMAFVITKQSAQPAVVLFEVNRQTEQKYLRNYFNSAYNSLDDTLSYSVFWKPLASVLNDIHTVYISADGVYHLINADILKDGSSGRFLMDNISVINVTNSRNTVTRGGHHFTFLSAALFGSPDFSAYSAVEREDIGFGESISDLPGTETEVNDISGLLKGNGLDVHTYIKDKATEQQLFKLDSIDVLHVATHGFFTSNAYGNDPMLGSGLVLAKDSGEKDGILTAYEASTLNLEKTKLVVLSACKTGLGAVKEGEGVYGLQRAFEVAGADNLIMTLWDIDDAVTKEFMVDFYRRLIQEKDINKAFTQARKFLRQKYPGVYYWGAFKLIRSN